MPEKTKRVKVEGVEHENSVRTPMDTHFFMPKSKSKSKPNTKNPSKKEAGGSLWLDILKWVVNAFFGLGTLIAQVMPQMPVFQRGLNPELDPQSVELETEGDKLFADYVMKLPAEKRKEFNAEWTIVKNDRVRNDNDDNNNNNDDNDKAGMDRLLQALVAGLKRNNLEEDAEELQFKHQVQSINDPVIRRSFLSRWAEINRHEAGQWRTDANAYLQKEVNDSLSEGISLNRNPTLQPKPKPTPMTHAFSSFAASNAGLSKSHPAPQPVDHGPGLYFPGGGGRR